MGESTNKVMGLIFIPLISLIISTMVSCIVAFIVQRNLNKHFNLRDEKERKTKEEHAELQKVKEEEIRNQRKEDMKETIEEAIKPLNKKVDELDKKLQINTAGTVTLLRDRMKISRDFYVDRGYATDSDKANWNELYSSYKLSGGNHFREYVDQWKETIEKLPKYIDTKR